jgi:SPP1 family predicted phage head-tail adaptor
MRAGVLRHRLELQNPIPNAGRFNEQDLKNDDHWRTFATVWGRVSPLSGVKLQYAHQTTPEATHDIEIRGRQSLLTVQSRIKFGARKFGIQAAPDYDERGIRLMIVAKEVQ